MWYSLLNQKGTRKCIEKGFKWKSRKAILVHSAGQLEEANMRVLFLAIIFAAIWYFSVSVVFREAMAYTFFPPTFLQASSNPSLFQPFLETYLYHAMVSWEYSHLVLILKFSLMLLLEKSGCLNHSAKTSIRNIRRAFASLVLCYIAEIRQ